MALVTFTRARSAADLQAAGAPADADGSGEFVHEKVPLGADAAGPFGVVPLLGLGQFLAEIGEVAPVCGAGCGVQAGPLPWRGSASWQERPFNRWKARS